MNGRKTELARAMRSEWFRRYPEQKQLLDIQHFNALPQAERDEIEMSARMKCGVA